MKKKLLTVSVAGVLALALVACGGGNNNQAAENNGMNNNNHAEENHNHNHNEENHNHNHENNDHDHDHGDGEHAHGEFEWIGVYDLEADTEYMLHFGASEDETLNVGFVKLGDNIEDLEHHAAHLMVTEMETVDLDGSFVAQPDYAYTLMMDPEHGHFNFTVGEAGQYALVFEHHPSENNFELFDADGNEVAIVEEHEGHGHDH